MGQKARLLSYLETHCEGLTQLQAFNELGICRLSERVRELERLGFLIDHEPVTVSTRDKPAHVVRYSLLRIAYG